MRNFLRLFTVSLVGSFFLLVQFSPAQAYEELDFCPDGVAPGTTICDPSQSPQKRYRCSDDANSMLFDDVGDCDSDEVCQQGECIGASDPTPSPVPTPTDGPLQEGSTCPNGVSPGEMVCVPAQGPRTRLECSATEQLVYKNCKEQETCSNGECLPNAINVSPGAFADGMACPQGMVVGNHICDPTQGDSVRFRCGSGLRLREAYCSGGLICRNGECDTLIPSDDDDGTIVSNQPLCNQAGDLMKGRCVMCFNQGKLWTAIGCIPFQTTTSMIRALLTVGLGIAGASVVLMTLGAGFLYTISRNDPKQVDEAKSLITSAVTGILFIIFSVAILRYIGVTILQLPAFG